MTTIDLGYRPRDWQREVHVGMKRFTVLALHRRAGKTELALSELIDKALRCNKELGLFFYVAPLLKQAKAIAWARLKQKVAPLIVRGLCETNESELWVKFTTNGSIIRCYGADNGDSMRGVRLDGVVVDEVADIKPEVWFDVLQPALSDRKGWALFIGTPHGVNLFSDLFYKARMQPDWHAALYTVYDTAALDMEEVRRIKSSIPENTFAREFLCSFEAAGDDQLLSLADIEEATRRYITAPEYAYAPRIIGVDPARFGDDRSVIFKRQGRFALKPKSFRGMDNMTLAGHVAQEIVDWKPDAVFVDEGNGSGVIDRLRQLGHHIIGVHFGGKAPKPQYVNQRTHMWYEMAEWIKAGGVIPADKDLMLDLAAPTYRFTAQDQIALESKDDIKKRGLPSPDLGDALALTFAMPVTRSLRDAWGEVIEAHGSKLHVETGVDWNPLSGV